MQALTRIRRDGVVHEPGTATKLLAVDAKTYADLLLIAAIAPVPWDALEVEPVPVLAPVVEEQADPRPGPAGAVE